MRLCQKNMRYLFLSFALSVQPLALSQAATFRGLETLPGGYASYAWGVSGDGQVVVGQSMALEGSEAVSWTRQGEISGLGRLPGGKDSLAKGASRDGSVIVGISSQYDSERGDVTGWWAFQWNVVHGIQSLGVGTANKVNASGSVVVGDNGSKAYRWANGLGFPLTGVDSVDCRDVSDDGLVAVGTIEERAYRWTLDQGPVDLGTLPGDQFSEAYGISGNGKYVVGVSYDRLSQAFRWGQTDGMIGLGSLPPSDASRANAVSSDGSVIAGLSSGAFVWDHTHGIRSMKELLTRLGFDLADWVIEEATGVSDDGRTIVGNGSFHGFPKAWVAFVDDLTLPELTLVSQGTTSLLSWPGLKELNLWYLQSANQVSGPWSNEDAAPVWDSGRYQVTLPMSDARKFYRLAKD